MTHDNWPVENSSPDHISSRFIADDPKANTRPSLAECASVFEFAWPGRGQKTYDALVAINALLYGNAVRLVPIVWARVLPYGHMIGVCYCAAHGADRIELMTNHADAGVLAHEMLHAFLSQHGESPKHDREPWRREISRMTTLLGGPRLRFALSKVGKVKRDGQLQSMRKFMPPADVVDGDLVMEQGEISRWPHTVPGLAKTIEKAAGAL